MKRFFSVFIPISTVNLIFAEIYDGHLLYSPGGGGGGQGGGNNDHYTRLMDSDNNVIHEWDHSNGCASMTYLRQDSILVYPYRVSNPTMDSGGVGGAVQYISWDGDILWNYVLSLL